jgi:hypothetical protein
MDIVAIIILGIMVVCGAAARWKLAIQAALVLAIFEGAIRKWAFPGAGNLIYFGKDIILFGAYIGAFLDGKRSRVSDYRSLSVFLIAASAIVFLASINPNQGSILGGGFGLKVYLWYLPLMWLIPSVFNTKEELVRFLRVLLLCMLPIGILGVFQFRAGPDSILNKYAQEASDSSNIAQFGDSEQIKARITGTFSYIAGYTTYLILCFSFIWPFLLSTIQKKYRALDFGIFFLILLNMFMTGARATIVFDAIFLSLLLIAVGNELRARVVKICFSLVLVGSVVFISNSTVGDAYKIFSNRAQNADSLVERMGWGLRPFTVMSQTGFFGAGAGVTHPARGPLQNALHIPPPVVEPPGMDFEPDQVLAELGCIGFLIWYAMRVALIIALWNTCQLLKDPFLKVLAFGGFAFHLGHIYLSMVINHTAGIYYWFIAGFIYLLPKLEALASKSRLVRRSDSVLNTKTKDRKPESTNVEA